MTARSITVRVDRLTETALELHKGNLSARVNIIGRDELGQLGKTFDVMAEKISTLVRDLDMEIG
jgi:methyl-accepting chemotaxis protein